MTVDQTRERIFGMATVWSICGLCVPVCSQRLNEKVVKCPSHRTTLFGGES